MKSIAVDLGGTKIKIAVVSDNEIISQAALPAFSENGLEKRLDDIEKSIRELAGIKTVGGIGIAFPGIVDVKGKNIISTNKKYADAVNINLERWCSDTFGLEMILENDANAALIGELSPDEKDAVMIILGTGIGTAAVIDGKLLRGRHNQAGCLGGHISIEVGGRQCTCGNRGCLEANASTWALPHIARDHRGFSESGLSSEQVIDFIALEKWYRKGDELAIQLFHHCVNCWSTGIVNLIHAYDPEVVILSGGVMKFKDFFERITERVKELAWVPCGIPEFRLSSKPEQSVVLGLHKLLEGSIAR